MNLSFYTRNNYHQDLVVQYEFFWCGDIKTNGNFILVDFCSNFCSDVLIHGNFSCVDVYFTWYLYIFIQYLTLY